MNIPIPYQPPLRIKFDGSWGVMGNQYSVYIEGHGWDSFLIPHGVDPYPRAREVVESFERKENQGNGTKPPTD